MPKLDGKIAWVTGAGSGIGEAAAFALADEGATVVLSGRRKEPLEAVARGIHERGGEAMVEAADLTKASDVDAVAQRIVAKFSRLDILVNNAGVNIVERAGRRSRPRASTRWCTAISAPPSTARGPCCRPCGRRAAGS